MQFFKTQCNVSWAVLKIDHSLSKPERFCCVFTEAAVIAKSNIIYDVKPWDDETDMKELEKHVRSINMEGLLWGACK